MFEKAFVELLIEKLLEHEKKNVILCPEQCFCQDVRIMLSGEEPDLLKEFEDQWE